MTRVWFRAYGVSNHNLKLQCKKFNRTRDIRNFPTQGWADTAFCTRKQSETYVLYGKQCLEMKTFSKGAFPSQTAIYLVKKNIWHYLTGLFHLHYLSYYTFHCGVYESCARHLHVLIHQSCCHCGSSEQCWSVFYVKYIKFFC